MNREPAPAGPLGRCPATTRIIDRAAGTVLAAAEIDERIDDRARSLGQLPPGVLALFAGRGLESILRYAACLRAGRPVILIDPAQSGQAVTDLLARYEPAAVLGTDEAGPHPAGRMTPPSPYADEPGASRWVRTGSPRYRPHPDLCLLLATSGTTGSPRLVRLSHAAVRANAHAIIKVLGIGPQEVSLTGLPLFYGYGLAVANTHLIAGATLVVTAHPPLTAGFWADVDACQATTFGAVPATYEMLHRLRWDPADHHSLRTLTQAGGRLRPALARHLSASMARSGGGLALMYGQTEATARMSILPPADLPARPASVGPALPGTAFTLTDPDPGQEHGEVVFHGPNVMMGYAHRAADLTRGDVQHGTLHTGDRGRLDADGYLYLSGRNSRLGKVLGIRLDLDGIEDALHQLAPQLSCPIAAVCAGDRLSVWCETGPDAASWAELSAALAGRLRLPARVCAVRPIECFPLLPTGKVDYRALEAA